jgi:mannose-6-phosphate isomerase-like protein (cupin superfamily)
LAIAELAGSRSSTLSVMNGSLETVLECADVAAMVEFFTVELGCRLELVTPADDPRECVVSHGAVRIHLVRSSRDVPGRLRLVQSAESSSGDEQAILTAPNGTVVEFVAARRDTEVPSNRPSLSVVRVTGGDAFGEGRAGMGYRDLLPDRWGGRFIASHILIADGGNVEDYVHFHRIRFQMIFVVAGWVEVVYEDQGEPFRMVAGDCVLQPPEIRHRVLRSSPGLEVIEVGCPAEHDTLVEHEITLPTATTDAERVFGGQRFVRHVAAVSALTPSATSGFLSRDTGIAEATDGLADVQVLTRAQRSVEELSEMVHLGEFAMYVVLTGSARLTINHDGDQRMELIGARDAVAMPPGSHWSWGHCSHDLAVLQVILPSGCVAPMFAV